MGMKFFNWKYFALTGIVCLFPILLGLLIWDRLPDLMPVHFDINGNPDNFSTKEFAVIGLPLIMVLLQGIACIASDLNVEKYGRKTKFETVTKWIIPVITIVLQLSTFALVLGYDVDIRIVAIAILGTLFLVLGYFMQKLDYVKNYNIEPEKAIKINRFMGYSAIVMGILFLISLFFSPIASLVCLLILIPYTIISVIYAIYVVKKK